MSERRPSLVAWFVREPIVQFLLIGVAIYLLLGLTGREAPTSDGRALVVTAGEIQWLEDSFSSRWMRPPTPEERQGLIDAYVREAVLYREAMAMRLDEDDVIIRRRLAQKLEFLFQDLADASPPTEEEVSAYFAEHAEQYRDPEVVTFVHVFLDPDLRGDRTLTDADAMLAELAGLDDPTQGSSAFGDRFMLQRYYPSRPESEIAKLFGRPFARSVFELEPGAWHGPVLSGYGTHLVFVHDRAQAPPAGLESVRDRVVEDLRADRRQTFNDGFVAELMARYDVVIEDAPPEEAVSAR